MAYFRIKQEGQPTKYIKSVDGANGTLEFTENLQEAMYRDIGFFADSEFGFIKFHFTKNYPELENMDIYDGYSDEDKCEEAVEAPIGGGWVADEPAVWDTPDDVDEPAAPIYVANDNEFAAAYNGIGVADVAAP